MAASHHHRIGDVLPPTEPLTASRLLALTPITRSDSTVCSCLLLAPARSLREPAFTMIGQHVLGPVFPCRGYSRRTLATRCWLPRPAVLPPCTAPAAVLMRRIKGWHLVPGHRPRVGPTLTRRISALRSRRARTVRRGCVCACPATLRTGATTHSQVYGCPLLASVLS